MITKFVVITDETESWLRDEAGRLGVLPDEVIGRVIDEYRKIRSAAGGDQSGITSVPVGVSPQRGGSRD